MLNFGGLQNAGTSLKHYLHILLMPMEGMAGRSQWMFQLQVEQTRPPGRRRDSGKKALLRATLHSHMAGL